MRQVLAGARCRTTAMYGISEVRLSDTDRLSLVSMKAVVSMAKIAKTSAVSRAASVMK